MVNHPQTLPPKNFSEDKRGDNGGVGFDDEFRGFFAKFTPSNLFIGDCTRVASIARCGITDLAEVCPKRDIRLAKVLMKHGDDTDGEVAGDAAAYLEEADGGFVAGGGIPVGEGDHVFDA